jgi:hypothetical protein
MGCVEGPEEADDHGARLEAGLVGGAGGVDDGHCVDGGQKECRIAADRCAGFDLGPIGCAG